MSLPTTLEQETDRPAWPAPRPARHRNGSGFRLRRWWIALGVLVAIVCTGGGAYLAYQNTLPTAVTLNISPGQKEVPTDSRIVFTFSRAVAFEQLQKNLSIVPATDGTLVSVSGQNAYAWIPAKPLLDLTRYEVTVHSFTDTSKHQFKGGQWMFTTTIVPRIASVTGAGGAPVADGSELQPGTPLIFTFNDAMVTSSVKLMLGTQPLALTWAPGSRSASTSTQGIPSGPFVVKLAPGAVDQTGHKVKASWTLVTGLYYRDTEHTIPLKYPALIQIPNDALAVDQNGLQAADVVFQYLAEGGITRLTAIFSNAPDLIGPIRSSRLVSLKLGRHYKGLLFQSGESAVTQSAAGSDPVPQFFDTFGYTFRTYNREAPDNLMIAGDGVNRAEAHFYPNVPAYTIQKSRSNPTGGTAATTVTVAEHTSTYSYDAIMGTYQKTEDGHLYKDPRTHAPLRIEMLIVMHTQETTLNISDGHGSFIHDFNLDTTGAADVYYKGFRYAATWNGSDVHNPIAFTTADGQALTLPPGLVWVDVTS